MLFFQPAIVQQTPYAEVAEALPAVACSGERIVAVDVRRYPPSRTTAGERAVAVTSEAVGLEHSTTNLEVVQAYMLLRVGDVCREEDRLESERLLRAQRFVASAAVTAIPAGEGNVIIRVVVVDEWPYVVGGALRGGQIAAVRGGNQNLRGRALAVVGSFERGLGYRTGFGLRVEKHGLLYQPAHFAAFAERRPLGGTVQFDLAKPFLTDGQRHAFQASLANETRFHDLVRPEGDDAAAETERKVYDVAWVARVGARRRDGLLGLAGVTLMREEMRTGIGPVVISDSGLVPTLDSALVGRYPDFSARRAGLILGVRALRFVTVSRFASLRAAQDVGRGIQVSMIVAPSLESLDDTRDMLVSGDIYGGTGTASSFLSMRVSGEVRANALAGPFRGVATSARFDWHRLASDRRTRITSVSGSVLGSAIVPSQLTLRDRDFGIIGLPRGHDAGGRRVVLRHEERLLLDIFRRRADLALAFFADAGRIWRGDVPYGATSPIRGSLGFGILGSHPSGKRTYRVDFAVPVNKGPGATGFAVRFSSGDFTGTEWMEARDVTRARGGTGPATLTRW